MSSTGRPEPAGELKFLPELPSEKVCGQRHPTKRHVRCAKLRGHRSGGGWFERMCSNGYETWVAS